VVITGDCEAGRKEVCGGIVGDGTELGGTVLEIVGVCHATGGMVLAGGSGGVAEIKDGGAADIKGGNVCEDGAAGETRCHAGVGKGGTAGMVGGTILASDTNAEGCVAAIGGTAFICSVGAYELLEGGTIGGAKGDGAGDAVGNKEGTAATGAGSTATWVGAGSAAA
jgi:hypothetical protein